VVMAGAEGAEARFVGASECCLTAASSGRDSSFDLVDTLI